MKRIIIEYDEKQSSDDDEYSLDLFSWLRNELDNAGYAASIEEAAIASDGSSVVEKQPVMVCSYCGSREVFSDAYVGINDPSDVLTYDDTHCMHCQGPCSTITEEEYKNRSKGENANA